MHALSSFALLASWRETTLAQSHKALRCGRMRLPQPILPSPLPPAFPVSHVARDNPVTAFAVRDTRRGHVMSPSCLWGDLFFSAPLVAPAPADAGRLGGILLSLRAWRLSVRPTPHSSGPKIVH